MRFLIRALKVLGWGVAGIVLTVLLAFSCYDVTEFQSRRDDIAKLIAYAHPAERLPPAALRRLMLTDGRDGLSIDTARILVFELDEPATRRGMAAWHATSFRWWLYVRLHLSTEEQLAITCGKTFLGRRAYGFEAGAQRYFQRPLTRLTEKELALLVILGRRPHWDRPERREGLVAARDALLARTYAAGRAPP
jgi:Transglycosylase